MQFTDKGTGLPLLLLHGFPLDRRIWQHQVDHLSTRCRVIAPDLPGFGESESTGPFTMESVADRLFLFLERLNAVPFVLGGLSMGGYVALAFAEKYSEHLRGLILTDARAQADTPEVKIGRNAMIELARMRGSGAVAAQMLPKMLAAKNVRLSDVARKMMEGCPAKTIEYACKAMRDRRDYSDLLTRLSVPALILAGQFDAITPPSMAEQMHHALKRSTLRIIPDAGHLSPIENPEQVSDAIGTFLQTI